MAILACSSSSNKENVPLQHGVSVKSHRMKRPGAAGVKARRRAPLRDITNLFLAPRPHSAAATSAAVPAPAPAPAREGLAPLPVAPRSCSPDVVAGLAAKGRRSLRKGFR